MAKASKSDNIDVIKLIKELTPGREVRLRYAYFITCQEVIKDVAGNITEIRCTYDPATRGGDSPDGRKVKSTIHWVSAVENVKSEVRMYDHLFSKPDPEDVPEGQTFLNSINPDSLKVIHNAILEPELGNLASGTRVQFERLGYFCVDPDSTADKKVFNLTINLRDTWAKEQVKQ